MNSGGVCPGGRCKATVITAVRYTFETFDAVDRVICGVACTFKFTCRCVQTPDKHTK